ncbi:MAG: hypothetical protein HY000_23405 [Planctomycetes bacterium]|nr:hypothetical protein [Planctomycetota bacterium]
MTRYYRGPRIVIDGEWVRSPNGHYHSWTRGEGRQWEDNVFNVLRKIWESKSGRALLEGINATKLKCEIVPIKEEKYEHTSMNQFSDLKSMKKGAQVWVLPTNEVYIPVPGGMVPPHAKLVTGTGHGSGARIFFHPGTWTAHSQMIGVDTQRLFTDVAQDPSWTPIDQREGLDTALDHFQPDDVLFHELVHVYRAMLGLCELVPTGDTWDDTEEFFAIVLANIYVSEMGRSWSLRGDHQPQFRSVKEARGSDTDADFYLSMSTTNGALIDQLCGEMKDFTDILADPANKIGAWNPLRFRKERLAREARATNIEFPTR